jgi:hypothetical protein
MVEVTALNSLLPIPAFTPAVYELPLAPEESRGEGIWEFGGAKK